MKLFCWGFLDGIRIDGVVKLTLITFAILDFKLYDLNISMVQLHVHNRQYIWSQMKSTNALIACDQKDVETINTQIAGNFIFIDDLYISLYSWYHISLE